MTVGASMVAREEAERPSVELRGERHQEILGLRWGSPEYIVVKTMSYSNPADLRRHLRSMDDESGWLNNPAG